MTGKQPIRGSGWTLSCLKHHRHAYRSLLRQVAVSRCFCVSGSLHQPFMILGKGPGRAKRSCICPNSKTGLE